MTSPFAYELALRLEAEETGDINAGFQAEIADPVWFLGRQWEMGEHRGEDCGSPVGVTVHYETELLENPTTDSRTDPKRVPLEALLEGEAADWWTLSRRIRVGERYAAALRAEGHGEAELEFAIIPSEQLTPPYDGLTVPVHDGLRLWEAFSSELGQGALTPGPPSAIADRSWQSARLAYTGTFTTSGSSLSAPRHDGGEVDWFTFDATASPGADEPTTSIVARMPHRLSYPGAPHPRYWQIESTAVDLGGHPPDRTHLGTLLLIEMTSTHADDWFSVPIAAPTGSLLRVAKVTIRTSFDELVDATPPTGWGIFRHAGMSDAGFLVLPTARTALTSPVLERIEFAIDEDANKVFAVERIDHGRRLDDGRVELAPDSEPRTKVIAGARHDYRYRPALGIRRHWWPYVVRSLDGRPRWVQATYDPDLLGMAPDGSANSLGMPMALINVGSAPDQPAHSLDSDVVPETGLVLETQYQLARATDGSPVLWKQRLRKPLLEGPTSGMRFDILEPQPREAS